MTPVLSRSQIQALDRSLMEQARVPGLVLMENAGRSASAEILEYFGSRAERTLVVCGTGNNGGDGFVVARHLASHAKCVRVIGLGRAEQLKGDALRMFEAFLGLGGAVTWIDAERELPALEEALEPSALVVDAIFGTGLSKPLSGLQLEAVRLINASQRPCCALDIPSGLDAESGQILGDSIRADLTVTFAYPKLGQFSSSAVERLGTLVTASLGVPEDCWQRVGASAQWAAPSEFVEFLPQRSRAMHKGLSGRVAIVAGSPGTLGAALLSAAGALRAGAGLVTHVGYGSTIEAIQGRVLEAMTRRVSEADLRPQLAEIIAKMDSVVLGPGLGTGASSADLVRETLEHAECPVVVDADALTLVAKNLKWLQHYPAMRILTPHVGELARILDTDVPSIEANRFEALARAVSLTNAVVVLKGAYTLVGAPEQLPFVVGGPCPALATGGTGDVLAGIIGALAVALSPVKAALCGVAWHNWAASVWQRDHAMDRGLLAHELADMLPDALAELSRTQCSD
jgi:ADP-dependent NAD(P)H-hydrate dehydratase / NAD(P)H-hydrate epimerase